MPSQFEREELIGDSVSEKDLLLEDDFFLSERKKPHIRMTFWRDFPTRVSQGGNWTRDGITHYVSRRLESVRENQLKFAYRNGLTAEIVEKRLIQLLGEMGISTEKLKTFTVKELLELSMSITVKGMQADGEVDRKFDYTRHHLFFYFDEIKRGDCDKYADLSKLFFNVLKRMADNTENFYVLDNRFGSTGGHLLIEALRNRIPRSSAEVHDWIVALALGEDGIWYTTHLDPTWVASGAKSSWDAADLMHYDPQLFLYRFYQAIFSDRGVLAAFLHDDLRALDEVQFQEVIHIVLSTLSHLKWHDSSLELFNAAQTRFTLSQRVAYNKASDEFPEMKKMRVSYGLFQGEQWVEALHTARKSGNWGPIRGRFDDSELKRGGFQPERNPRHHMVAELIHLLGGQEGALLLNDLFWARCYKGILEGLPADDLRRCQGLRDKAELARKDAARTAPLSKSAPSARPGLPAR